MGVIGFTVICVVLYLIFSSMNDGEEGCLSGIFKIGAGLGASWLLLGLFLFVLSLILGCLASL